MTSIAAETVAGWLASLDIEPVDQGEREGIHSWDLVLDAQRRADIRITLILDPERALLCWLHYAPPLNDSFRVSYHRFLRWNDELPFVKFALSADERPMLTAELPVAALDRDTLGGAICRLLATCDVTLDEAVRWLWPGAKRAPQMERRSRQAPLMRRYASVVAEVMAAPIGQEQPVPVEAADPDTDATAR